MPITMPRGTCPRFQWPTSCATTATTAPGSSVLSSVSKSAIRRWRPKPVKNAFAFVERRDPSTT